MAISANVSSTVFIHNNFSFANIKSSTGLTHIMKRNRLSTKNILITLFTFSRSKALIIFNLFQLKYFYVIPTTKIARNISKWWWWYRQRASIYCIATLCVGICQRISLDCPIIYHQIWNGHIWWFWISKSHYKLLSSELITLFSFQHTSDNKKLKYASIKHSISNIALTHDMQEGNPRCDINTQILVFYKWIFN